MPPVDARLWAALGAFCGASIVVAITWFTILETIGMRNKYPGDTLTEVTRALHLPIAFWLLGGWGLASLVAAFVIWWPIHLELHRSILP